jgi:hypothetical protein
LQKLGKLGRQGFGPARVLGDQNRGGFRDGDASVGDEQGLCQADRTASHFDDAGADPHGAWPVHFAAELEVEAPNDELDLRKERQSLAIHEQLHACVLAAHREHGIGDVAVAVGVGEAELLGRDQCIVGDILGSSPPSWHAFQLANGRDETLRKTHG